MYLRNYDQSQLIAMRRKYNPKGEEKKNYVYFTYNIASIKKINEFDFNSC